MDMNNKFTDRLASSLLTATITVSMIVGALVWLEDSAEAVDDDPYGITVRVSCTDVIMIAESFTAEEVMTCREKLKGLTVPVPSGKSSV